MSKYILIEPLGKLGQIAVSSTPDKCKRCFELPTETEELARYLRANLYLLVKGTTHGTANWRIALGALNGATELLSIVLADVLERSPAVDLIHWQRTLSGLNAVGIAKVLEAKIDERVREMQIQTIDADAVFRAESERGFDTKRVASSYHTLTSVHLTSEVCSKIISSLGVRYDLFKMIDSDRLQHSTYQLQAHESVLEVLQEYGFPKVGRMNQEPLSQTNKQKWSKAVLGKVLASPSSGLGEKSGKKIKPAAASSPRDSLLLHLTQQILALKVKDWPQLTELPALLTAARDQPDKVSLQNQVGTALHRLLLTKNELITAQGEAHEYEVINSSCQWRLDPWQAEVVDHIKSGTSVLVNGPTSGGKTFVSMVAVDWILNKKDGVRLAYIAPTFHLALQIYANIKKTFPHVVSLVTGVANVILPESSIWIGTPMELESYLEATGETFSIGIFDEIHTLSTTYGEGRLDALRSEAIGNLLSKCKDQVVALSATIHAADIPVLQGYLSRCTGIAQIVPVVYTERPIPLQSYVWSGAKLESAAADTPIPTVPVTPTSTLRLLLQLQLRDLLPALLFDTSEKASFDNYTAYLGEVEREEQRVYRNWHSAGAGAAELISAYNSASEEYYLNSHDLYQAERGEGWKAMLPRVQEFAGKRRVAVEGVIGILTTGISRALQEKNSEYAVTNSPPLQAVLNRVGIALPLSSGISVEARDLILELRRYLQLPMCGDLNPEAIAPLPAVCDSIGPHFRIGDRTQEMDAIRTMLQPGSSQEARKARKQMLVLCEAERIREVEAQTLFSLIARGLEYGVGIILPTMPLVVQYHLMNLLNRKTVKVVFASKSMSMGINFPIRTVVVRSSELESLCVSTILQMTGRAGRRRLDNQAHCVVWNVANGLTAGLNTLPRISLPATGSNRGSLIQNPREVAIAIDLARFALFDAADALSIALGFLGTGITEVADIPIVVDGGREDVNEEEAKSAAAPEKATGLDVEGMIRMLTSCVHPVGEALGLSSVEIVGVTERVHRITLGSITEEIREDVYGWVNRINLIKAALQEIHTRFHRCSNLPALQHISSVYELLHRISFRQLRL